MTQPIMGAHRPMRLPIFPPVIISVAMTSVEGYRGLDTGDGRAHILGDLGNGDIHHRAVERHEELT